MNAELKNLRILIVSPEVTRVPSGMGPGSRTISARAGGLGDICATQIHALWEHGANVHLAIPNYRNVFKATGPCVSGIDINDRLRKFPENRIHLAQDRSFYYHSKLFVTADQENVRTALSFQREVINLIIPEVQPDLIHCYGWMTGLIPAMARQYGIPCLFTMYRLNSPKLLLSTIEDRGIDPAVFWKHCFYCRMPIDYQETRSSNPVDLLTSGLFSAKVANVFSHSYLKTLIDDSNNYTDVWLKAVLKDKMQSGNLCIIPPTPDPSFNPTVDRALIRHYGPNNHFTEKLFNKLHLQALLNLRMDSAAPLCFWPTRLDGSRRGCRLMAEVLPEVLERYRNQRLQLVFVADGDYQEHIRTAINHLHASDRAVVCDFDSQIYRLAYAAAEFVLMPLKLDPCALPCKIGQRYGALPIAHDICAIHDCVEDLDTAGQTGSGFLFKHLNREGLIWAIDQAMAFYNQPRDLRSEQVRRIMMKAHMQIDPEKTAQQMVNLYKLTVNHFQTDSKQDLQEELSNQIAA